MTIISLNNVGVRYRILRPQARHLRYHILGHEGAGTLEDFWALRRVSFDVEEGAAIAIIGDNGAGKSTLCKIIAEILTPDEGEVKVVGRVSPVLGLGAGFAGDLTGRQNIELSGALMGLPPEEIAAKEEAIIEFADIGDFIDNPVRMYSSGMSARLGFAIATAIEPDVLLLDEVLSVGDVGFTEKCKERMKGLMEHARAIILVTHSMDDVREMATSVLWLSCGEIVQYGPVDEVVPAYEEQELAGKEQE